MYELIQLTDICYYIECPSKVGIVRLNEKDVCLIDSGNNKEMGRRIKKTLDANGWNLISIYNTHAHADHIGGNSYLQSQTNCNIYASSMQNVFIRYPMLIPVLLYGGFPPKEFCNKFLLAQDSQVQEINPEEMPEQLSMILLSGHAKDMLGFRTSDNVVFLGDCLLSQEILDKYKIGVIYDVEEYLATLEQVKSMSASYFVPSHGAVTNDIAPLAQYNIDKTYEIADKIHSLCIEPISAEGILQRLFTDYQLAMNPNQYVLVGTSVRSILTWLKNAGKVQMFFDNNMMLWQAAD